MRFTDKFIKHNRSMDVCFEVRRALDLPHKVVLTGYWINMGFVNSWPLMRQTIKIPREQLRNWQFTSDIVSCLRYANWSKIHE